MHGKSDSNLVQPLFILGAPRSFTSLICAMVGQHPDNYGVPELNLFVADSLKEVWEQMVGLRQIQLHGLLRTVAYLYSGEQTLASVDMARRWVMLRLERSTAQVYRELCVRVAPLRVVDKSPIYVARYENLMRIHDVFPCAYYLHLLRHPRTQGESILKVAEGAMAILVNSIDYTTEPPMVDPQIAWCRIQENILKFLKIIPDSNKMRLHGEDILNQPNSYLKQICQWLKISDDNQKIQAMLHPEDSPFACLGPIGAHLGNDINFLRSPRFRYQKIPSSTLDGSLSWRRDGGGFNQTTLELATEMGYQ
ncbi:MAG: sulfotransferase [Candidatus Competibacter sp.]|nr:sulfotransferase [Candidatus Competibacter sp.]